MNAIARFLVTFQPIISNHYWASGCPCFIIMCFLRLVFTLHDFPHTGHLKGFSPVWIIACLFTSELCRNRLSQMSHLCGFCPVWLMLCRISLPRDVNVFRQNWHVCITFLECSSSKIALCQAASSPPKIPRQKSNQTLLGGRLIIITADIKYLNWCKARLSKFAVSQIFPGTISWWRKI